MQFLVDISFLDLDLWDILDILIVSYLIYHIYRLLKGSVAFNIFVGLLLVYVAWWLVSTLEMQLLSTFLSQFVSVGVILLIIIFQPEIRRFLLDLGDSTLKQRSHFLRKFFDSGWVDTTETDVHKRELTEAVSYFGRNKIGALIVFGQTSEMHPYIRTGKTLQANLSAGLLESIFQKDSPLHDGAVVLIAGKIHSASCILPVSENRNLPGGVGLRHRAAVGVTEQFDVACLIVSEETGKISTAYAGNLDFRIDQDHLNNFIQSHFRSLT